MKHKTFRGEFKQLLVDNNKTAEEVIKIIHQKMGIYRQKFFILLKAEAFNDEQQKQIRNIIASK